MVGPRQLYRRADEWARGLSRLRYALLTGAFATASVLAVGVLFGTSMTFQAVTMGVTMAALYYAFDMNARAD
ncbi:hypothetical protein DVK05_14800 [Halorubrum sp. Atlit-8R]|uniref:hypothetical protein n=1 Tax=unclassified Halorubrum TaxID=2642239 RepID=UPI000EF2457E|nr:MULTISPECIES: hypothetical protein [unclassified Halorubrum]RLM63539.1 hypothetical protein DVK08_16545 [Halorubrum sp. Atlit-9R]RLM77015.1 hypothetical protein DVK05_14800 [Halorubrum sp. Atlit-8R]